MTEMTAKATERFILHWGEMGTRWGINRTVAQIHALLFISEEPLTAEGIAEALGVARSNVSSSIRELQGWGVVRPVHVLGDRRTHFEATRDVWLMARTILEQRKRREIDPTAEALRACAEAAGSDGSGAYAQARLADLLELFDGVDLAFNELASIPVPAIRAVLRTRGRFRKFLSFFRGE